MNCPRIFVSHSAKEKYSKSFLKDLSTELERNGFDVFIDGDRLKPGGSWREEIYTWIGLCHGAVILLSESAIRQDCIWVPRESSLLLWRKALDPKFVVIPVFLGSVTAEDINTGPFQDLKLNELQAPSANSTNQVMEEIVNQLDTLKSFSTPTPLEGIADQIVFLIRDVPNHKIEEAGEILGIDLGPWNPSTKPFHSLALKLLQVPLRKATEALEVLMGYLDDPTADRILALVAPSWVNLCAARLIPECAKSYPQPVALALNADSFFAAQMYVRKGSCQSPRTSWPVFKFSGVHGEAVLDDIVAEIEECLITAFRIRSNAFDNRTPDQILRNVLEIRKKEGKPVFLVLERKPSTSRLLPQLQRAFPELTFFILTSDEILEQEELNLGPIRLLEPILEEGVELAAQNDYAYAQSVLCPTLSY